MSEQQCTNCNPSPPHVPGDRWSPGPAGIRRRWAPGLEATRPWSERRGPWPAPARTSGMRGAAPPTGPAPTRRPAPGRCSRGTHRLCWTGRWWRRRPPDRRDSANRRRSPAHRPRRCHRTRPGCPHTLARRAGFVLPQGLFETWWLLFRHVDGPYRAACLRRLGSCTCATPEYHRRLARLTAMARPAQYYKLICS